MSENGLQSPLVDEKPRGSRWHWFRLYYDVAEFTQVLKSHSGAICHCHYIEHAMDYKDNGELAKPHIHCLLYLHDYKTASAISKWFSDDCGIMHFNCREPPIAMRYLIHLGFEDKYQYDVESCLHIGDTKSFFKALADVDKRYDSAINVVDDILDGCSTYDLVSKYGRDFIYHFNSYIKCVEFIVSERLAEARREEFKKNVDEEYISPLTLFDCIYDDLKKNTDDVPF